MTATRRVIFQNRASNKDATTPKNKTGPADPALPTLHHIGPTRYYSILSEEFGVDGGGCRTSARRGMDAEVYLSFADHAAEHQEEREHHNYANTGNVYNFLLELENDFAEIASTDQNNSEKGSWSMQGGLNVLDNPKRLWHRCEVSNRVVEGNRGLGASRRKDASVCVVWYKELHSATA